MDVRIWRSFSCNNSGSYYMVATFGDAKAAKASAAELTEFLGVHAKQVDTMWEEDGDPTETPTAAALALAEKNNFDWEGFLLWGDEGAEGDEPHVVAMGNTVVLYHSYCGGFGEGLPKYLEAIGAKTGGELDGEPCLSCIAKIPDTEKGKAVAEAVSAFFSQSAEEWIEINDLDIEPPWGTDATENIGIENESLTHFFDGQTIGFVLFVQVQGVDEVSAYLETNGITDYQLAFDVEGDKQRFRAIRDAACPECKTNDIRFLEAKAYDAPTDQLACQSCGGMFPLADFIKEEDEG